MTSHGTITATTAQPPRRREHNSYNGIETALLELATLIERSGEYARLREEILKRCLPLADHIARRFTGRGEFYDDLFQVASLGLIASVDRYDPHRGTPFLGFAVPTIMGEVRRHFRDHGWAVRVPRRTQEIQQRLAAAIEAFSHRHARMPTALDIAVELGVDLLEVTQAMLAANAYRSDSLDTSSYESDGEVPPNVAAGLGDTDPGFQFVEDAITVAPLLEDLDSRERAVLHLRFYRGLTQVQIADHLGVSQMQVSRVLSKTLTELRERALDQDA
ncbi:SigB/SigF/SigG family RNA polymerase sigma factor [Nocardia sp. NPDC058058]|uniref:SigB/SigF/SigG family RNA polymerase sigma factor n=1 Tax=Nocardia sp. NPDC058058 TaxID=3346317 RepID=UPI0036DD40FB